MWGMTLFPATPAAHPTCRRGQDLPAACSGREAMFYASPYPPRPVSVYGGRPESALTHNMVREEQLQRFETQPDFSLLPVTSRVLTT